MKDPSVQFRKGFRKDLHTGAVQSLSIDKEARSSIEIVSRKRMAQESHMCSDLMSPARFQP